MHLKTQKSRNSSAAALCSRVPPAHSVLAGGGRGQRLHACAGGWIWEESERGEWEESGRYSQMGERYLFRL